MAVLKFSMFLMPRAVYFHLLDLGVQAFAGGIGNSEFQISQDILNPVLEHFGLFDHRL